MDKLSWNKSSCLDYLRGFDAFKHKYLNNDDSKLDADLCTAWDDILSSQSHGISNHNFSAAEEAEASQGIEQVYRDTEHYTNEYIEMLNLVRDKFIYDYTGIPGLCCFFSPAYFEYEWGMHMEIDYDKHISRFYRDHYIHQIRNMFEMFTLLDNFGYYEKCRDAYLDPENNIGTYILEVIQQEMLSLNPIDLELYGKILYISNERIRNKWGEAIQLLEFLRNISGDLDPEKEKECRLKLSERLGLPDCAIAEQIKACPAVFAEKELSAVYRSLPKEYSKALRDLMLRHVIYSATIITSLVHDIGYPISYIRRISDRINRNLPINSLLSASNNNYAEVERALQNSLLFRIVDKEKIKRRLNNNDEHGAQSAIVLLMYFHQHGGSLSALQKCAVEVAALATYNHTNKYWVINKPKDDPELVRSDLRKAPLSHIFRLCDDLQEWDRVYFEVTDKSSLMICPRCHTPITREFGTDIKKPEEKKYYCCCAKDCARDTNMFVSRRIINVIGCDSMQVEQIANKNSQVVTKFTMNYDCAALLNIMTFSTSNAKVRAKGIRDLKKLHSYQGMYDSILVDSFVSGNPFTVKIRILEQYIKLIMHKDPDFWGKNEGDVFAEVETDPKKILSVFRYSRSNVKSLWNHTVMFYLMLKRFGDDFEENCWKKIEDKKYDSLGFNTTNKSVLDEYNKKYKERIKDFREKAKKQLETDEYLKGYFSNNETMLALGIDYLLYRVHLLGYKKIEEVLTGGPASQLDVRIQNVYRQFYEQLNTSNDYLCNQVDKYISRADYDKVKDACNDNNVSSITGAQCIDFFADYGLFVKLWDEVQKAKVSFFSAAGTKPKTYNGRDFIFSASGDPKELPRIICKTPAEEFYDRYDLELQWIEEDVEKTGTMNITINWNDRSMTAEATGRPLPSCDKLQNLLKKLYTKLSVHHHIQMVEKPSA